METKVISPRTCFVKEGKTTLKQIHEYASKVVSEINGEVKASGIETIGPMEFIYYGASDNMEKEFTLQIALPVRDERKCREGFSFIKTSEFKCISHYYKGDVTKLFPVYEKLYQEIFENQIEPNGEMREIYVNWEYLSSEKNITEIQIGIN
jgi:effector-binding domain-containing protein